MSSAGIDLMTVSDDLICLNNDDTATILTSVSSIFGPGTTAASASSHEQAIGIIGIGETSSSYSSVRRIICIVPAIAAGRRISATAAT